MTSSTKTKHQVLQLQPQAHTPSQSALQLAQIHAFMAEAMTAEGIVGDRAFSAAETTTLSAYICGRQDSYARSLTNEQLGPEQSDDESLSLGSRRHASAFSSQSDTIHTDTSDQQTRASTRDSFVFASDATKVAQNRLVLLPSKQHQKSPAQKA
ncbi:MAG: hypothetical protein ABJM43_08225 [Paracoccaceae bacterium]